MVLSWYFYEFKNSTTYYITFYILNHDVARVLCSTSRREKNYVRTVRNLQLCEPLRIYCRVDTMP
jgi:hypothetical protein